MTEWNPTEKTRERKTPLRFSLFSVMKPVRVDGLTNGKPTIMPPMILACSESSRDSARTQLKHAGYGPSAFSVSLIFSVMKPVRLVPRKMEGWGHEMCGRVATAACTTCTTCTRFALAQSLGVFHSRPTAVSMPVRCVIALRGRPTQGTAQGDKGRLLPRAWRAASWLLRPRSVWGQNSACAASLGRGSSQGGPRTNPDCVCVG